MAAEEQVKKVTYNYSKIRRVSASFKCDICSKLFDGDDAESQYKSHVAECDQFDVKQIITPPTIDIPKYVGTQELDVQGKNTGIIIPSGDSANKTIEDVIADMKNVVSGQPHVEWQINYVCPVCNIKSKQNKKTGNLISLDDGSIVKEDSEFQFDSIEEFDQHLWHKHDIAVSREKEIKIINRKTGDRMV